MCVSLAQVYDQVAASRNRLSKQLSAKNKYIRHLEELLEERMQVSFRSPSPQNGLSI